MTLTLAKNPYREFAYCPLCQQYKDNDIRGLISTRMFRALAISLKGTNPMYHPDSNDLLEG
jgi:hypothetical protein